MTERRRAIVLDEKVREPRQGIWHNERREDPPRPPQHDRRYQQRPARERSDGVKNSRGRLTVRQDVMRPELDKVGRRGSHARHFISSYRGGTLRKKYAAVPGPAERGTAAWMKRLSSPLELLIRSKFLDGASHEHRRSRLRIDDHEADDAQRSCSGRAFECGKPAEIDEVGGARGHHR